MKSYDTSKLPTWARQKIALLEREVADKEKELAAHGKLLDYSEPGLGYGCGIHRRSIPTHMGSIGWVTKSGIRFNIVLNDDEQLEVNVSGYGIGHPAVYPRSSNHVFIGIDTKAP